MATEDETPPPPKSAEDRKAASALANLDSTAAEDATTSSTTEVDQEAIHKAMKGLPAKSTSATATVSGGGGGGAGAKQANKPKKLIKLDPEDVGLIVEQLEVSKGRAGELLRQHEGSAVGVLRMFAGGCQE